jgi:hypothetical protein
MPVVRSLPAYTAMVINFIRAKAYEDAAKIAEMYLIHDPDDGQHGSFIANAIRARAAEVWK